MGQFDRVFWNWLQTVWCWVVSLSFSFWIWNNHNWSFSAFSPEVASNYRSSNFHSHLFLFFIYFLFPLLDLCCLQMFNYSCFKSLTCHLFLIETPTLHPLLENMVHYHIRVIQIWRQLLFIKCSKLILHLSDDVFLYVLWDPLLMFLHNYNQLSLLVQKIEKLI